MCLASVEERPTPSRRIQEGFKVFTVRSGEGETLYPQFQGKMRCGDHLPIVRGQWLSAKNTDPDTPHRRTLDADTGQRYPVGFHIFPNRWAAEEWAKAGMGWARRVVPVRYREVVAIGEQHGLPVIVARQLYVPKSDAT